MQSAFCIKTLLSRPENSTLGQMSKNQICLASGNFTPTQLDMENHSALPVSGLFWKVTTRTIFFHMHIFGLCML